ncbi:MAG TPA: hypothetical protein VK631_12015 [Solirubrobacteraceae bacterium]|nr:hypothetical protein [Solirubrobacteraceae bacterium]
MSPSDFWALLDGPGLHEIRCRYSEGPARVWLPTDCKRPFERLIRSDDCFVSAVPRRHEDSYTLGAAHVLWARLERPECAERLARLPAGPTLVLREGRSSRRTALWALSRPLWGEWIDRANARLAHAVKGRRGAADASQLVLSPFTRLTNAKRPVSIYVEYESDTYATARQIVGALPDAPALDGWRAAA